MTGSGVSRISVENLDEILRLMRTHLSHFEDDYSHLYNHAGLFLIDLWAMSPVGAEAWDEIPEWLEQFEIPHQWHVLTLSTRLIAIENQDDAFLFYLKFR